MTPVSQRLPVLQPLDGGLGAVGPGGQPGRAVESDHFTQRRPQDLVSGWGEEVGVPETHICGERALW